MLLRHWLHGVFSGNHGLNRAGARGRLRRSRRRRRPRLCRMEALEDRTLLSADPLALGIMGDSLSDEYFDQGIPYAVNWAEQSVELGRLDLGSFQDDSNWGDARNFGYEYNWAVAGATTDTLISEGQHTGLAAQINDEGIEHALLFIGANDFFPFAHPENPYANIYNENWTTEETDDYVTGRIENIETILDVVQPTGVNLLMTTFPDYGIAPFTIDFAGFDNAEQRDLVTDVIQQVNTLLIDLADERNIPVVDVFAFSQAVFGPNTDLRETITVGGVEISLRETEDDELVDEPGFEPDPTLGFVDDGIHPHEIVSAGISALMVRGLNLAYNTGIDELTEQEIVERAGLTYVEDTFFDSAEIGTLSDYIVLPAGTGDPGEIVLFDETTGRWHFGPNINQRFQQQLGSRWSTEVAWDFHHGDFTGNGLLDVAGRNPSNGQWWVLESTGDGFTTQSWGRWAADADAGWRDVQVGDFNGDGQDDIIGRTSTGQWWVAESTGERFANRFYGRWAAEGWHATVVGDFNGDGRDGVAGIRTTNGQWWIAQPVDVNGAFRFSTSFAGRWSAPEDVGWQHLMAADFTGDGRSDVVGQTASGQWWIGASDGTSLSTFFAGAWSPEAGIDDVFLGDFDGDGMADLAGRNTNGSWFVLRSNGLGERMTNERWGRWSADVEWTTLVGDFTGNGRDDIAGYVPTNGQLWVAASTGERFENRFFGQWDPLESVGFAAAGPLGG